MSMQPNFRVAPLKSAGPLFSIARLPHLPSVDLRRLLFGFHYHHQVHPKFPLEARSGNNNDSINIANNTHDAANHSCTTSSVKCTRHINKTALDFMPHPIVTVRIVLTQDLLIFLRKDFSFTRSSRCFFVSHSHTHESHNIRRTSSSEHTQVLNLIPKGRRGEQTRPNPNSNKRQNASSRSRAPSETP